MGLFKGANVVDRGRQALKQNTMIQTVDLLPHPPESLGIEGKKRWHEIGDILIKRKTWSNDWCTSLEHLCRSYDNLAEIDATLLQPQETFTVVSANQRSVKLHPLLEYRLKIESFISGQLNYFGLTPMSCKGIYTRIEAPTDESGNPTGVRVRNRKAGPMFKED